MLRKFIWNILSNLYPLMLRIVYGMQIGEGVRISYKARLDKSINPGGIHIGDSTWVLAGATILAHDYCRGSNGIGKKYNTYTASNCVIGINSIIMPGVRIGDNVIIGAGAVVTHDIPDGVIAVGNPAKVVRTGIQMKNGQISYDDI